MNRLLTTSVVLLAVAAAAAGCGSSKKASTTAGSPRSTSPATATTISSRNSPVGAVLVDSSGRTLYMFEGDRHAGQSSCNGSCASAWPPVIAGGSATAGNGVSQAKLTTTMRSDGSKQVVYNGRPLYRFSGDGSAGDLKGQNVHAFGAGWHVLSPAGQPIDRSVPASSSGSSPGGSSGSAGGAYGGY